MPNGRESENEWNSFEPTSVIKRKIPQIVSKTNESNRNMCTHTSRMFKFLCEKERNHNHFVGIVKTKCKPAKYINWAIDVRLIMQKESWKSILSLSHYILPAHISTFPLSLIHPFIFLFIQISFMNRRELLSILLSILLIILRCVHNRSVQRNLKLVRSIARQVKKEHSVYMCVQHLCAHIL